jgi:hypothetical protein
MKKPLSDWTAVAKIRFLTHFKWNAMKGFCDFFG